MLLIFENIWHNFQIYASCRKPKKKERNSKTAQQIHHCHFPVSWLQKMYIGTILSETFKTLWWLVCYCCFGSTCFYDIIKNQVSVSLLLLRFEDTILEMPFWTVCQIIRLMGGLKVEPKGLLKDWLMGHQLPQFSCVSTTLQGI